MLNKANILLVDDEEDILELLKYNLKKEGYEVATAKNGFEALDQMTTFKPDLMILDIMMPGMDGVELCKNVRGQPDSGNILICFLTARSESFTQINALDAGGDDFISKPIKPKLLLSKIKAILRRHPRLQNQPTLVQRFGDLEINYENYEVLVGSKIVPLAKKEFELLKLLTSRPGKVFGRREILSQVWGMGVMVGDRTIDVHIRKLREKIGPDFIYTMKGVGYKFDY